MKTVAKLLWLFVLFTTMLLGLLFNLFLKKEENDD